MESTSSRTISAASRPTTEQCSKNCGPNVTDVIPPDVARTMVAMLEDVVQFGTGVRAKELGRPSGGKTGTTNDFTDAWYIGFTPQITAGVWVGNDDSTFRWARKKPARAPRFPSGSSSCSRPCRECRSRNFRTWCRSRKLAGAQPVQVDTPDTAPPADAAEQGLRGAARRPNLRHRQPAAATIRAKAACCSATPAPQLQRNLTRSISF